ncbi:IQ domain-containing protein M-like [Chiloscyllium plagiosum]|uniref:IQ domain-containing protein M-like n=1 Tax=Chiloscyllium plagiosum TaxID=36176 RepID=UPI001CB7E079|nr:IQ domain-containing protein M-like [Chiloscyllium plagiosum]
MQTIQMTVLGHRLPLKVPPKVEVKKYPKLAYDIIKRPELPAHAKKPSKVGRPLALYFQPKDKDEITKAFELQKRVNAAVNIHDLFSGYINRNDLLKFLSIQSEKYLNLWERHLQRERQNELHKNALMWIYSRPQNMEMKTRQKYLRKRKIQHKIDRRRKFLSYQRRLQKFNAVCARRLEKVRPHKDLLDAFQPKKTGPSAYERKMAAIFIQKYIKGWLVRTKYNRIKIKSVDHGASLLLVVKQYRNMMTRLRRRFNAPQEQIPLVFSELEDWLDKKKKYEDLFTKRAFQKFITRNELINLFEDCNHYPSQHDIKRIWALINKDSSVKLPDKLKKHQVLELAFTMYPPLGARLDNRSIHLSTWRKPIVEGEEGQKYILYKHPILKKADIQVVGDLIAKSFLEREQSKV